MGMHRATKGRKTHYLTEDIEPAQVLRHFEDICSIPHGSGYEEALRNHIKALAKRNGLFYAQDEKGNLLVRVPAGNGAKSIAPMLIQGHMDMVLKKNSDIEKDLIKEPVDLVRDGNILRADGTSLGADNAVGLMMMMALMEDTALRKPELELLFTVEEETGQIGIRAFDASKLRSRRMLNTDSGDPDCLAIGAAGGASFTLTKKCSADAIDGVCIKIEISGLKGGHPGVNAGKNRASALGIAGQILFSLCEQFPVRLGELDSPDDSGFPQWCTLVVAVPGENVDAAKKLLREINVNLSEDLKSTEPDFKLNITGASIADAASVADTRELADFMLLVPYDAVNRDAAHPDWVLCAALLSNAVLKNWSFTARFRIRANKTRLRDVVILHLKALCRANNIAYTQKGEFTSPWPARADSSLQDLCLAVYRKMFGKEMKLVIENGVVEAGTIVSALPDMDAVGFAPMSRGAHTTDEKLYLDTVAPVWEMLKEILARMCDEE